MLITHEKNSEFEIASRNIEKLVYKSIEDLTLTDILKEDKLIFTLDGILAMTQFLHERTVVRHKPQPVKVELPLLRGMAEKSNPKKFKTVEVSCRLTSRNLPTIHRSHST